MRLRYIIATVIAVLALTAWITAQELAVTPVPPKVMTGSDLGFRVEGLRGGTPVGTFVVKVNGEWVEVGDGPVRRR
jgi:hypothetical protein